MARAGYMTGDRDHDCNRMTYNSRHIIFSHYIFLLQASKQSLICKEVFQSGINLVALFCAFSNASISHFLKGDETGQQ